MKTIAIIQARMNSTRLPGKVLADVGGRPMLHWQLNRLAAVNGLDAIIVATSEAPADDVLVAWLAGQGRQYFRGSEEDVLDRFYKCASVYQADVIVRVTADDPLKDPGVIQRALDILIGDPQVDYCSNTLHPTYPEGLDIEVFRFTALAKTHKEARLPSEREHVTPYIWTHPEQFRIVDFAHSRDLSHWRWTVDKPEDLEFVRAIFAAFPDRPLVTFEEIVAHINAHPWLLDINTGRTVRNEGYRKTVIKEQQ